MGKHTEPRRSAPRTPWQSLQNAALPAALLIVVGVIVFASPALRFAGDEYVAGSPTSSEPVVDDDWPPTESASPKAKEVGAPASKLRYKAEIIQATHLKRTPEPKIPEGYVRVPRSALQATSFTVASYNVLGFGHTAPGGNRRGYADGRTRTRWAVDQLRGHDVSVVGLQEFQIEQFHAFNSVAGGEYAVYPGAALGRSGVRTSLAWRRAEWTAVEASTISVPYFDGGRLPAPYVLLRHNVTGQHVWFTNFHNPADAHGPAQGARNAAMALEVSLFNRLRAETGHPVISTGDFNERDEVLCRFATGAGMTSADGGYADASGCHTPRPMQVDWIFGTPEVSFSNYLADRGAYVARTSDHPLVRADALIAPSFVAERCLAKARDSVMVFCPPSR